MIPLLHILRTVSEIVINFDRYSPGLVPAVNENGALFYSSLLGCRVSRDERH